MHVQQIHVKFNDVFDDLTKGWKQDRYHNRQNIPHGTSKSAETPYRIVHNTSHYGDEVSPILSRFHDPNFMHIEYVDHYNLEPYKLMHIGDTSSPYVNIPVYCLDLHSLYFFKCEERCAITDEIFPFALKPSFYNHYDSQYNYPQMYNNIVDSILVPLEAQLHKYSRIRTKDMIKQKVIHITIISDLPNVSKYNLHDNVDNIIRVYNTCK